MVLPRRFALIRHTEYTGVSGIGVVAYGVAFSDGQVVLRWCSAHPATSMWNSMEDMLAIHSDGEATSVEWIDAPHGEIENFLVDASRRGRRRAGDPSAPDGAEPAARNTHEPPAEPVAQRARPDAAPAPAEDVTTSAAASTEEPETAKEPLPRRIPGAVGLSDTPPSAESAGTPGLLNQEEPSAPHTPNETAATEETNSPLRDRRILRPVRTKQESPVAPLLTSDEPDPRNGHLYIDTAPLLLTFSEPDEEPAVHSPRRRGGRHRRADPDAAG
ncbi:MAG TPA: hypothetical protein VFZ63_15965 [Jiangellaceae bacterium]